MVTFLKTNTWGVALGPTHMIFLTYNLGTSFMKWGLLASALKDQEVDRARIL